MPDARPIEIEHLAPHLHQHFDGLVPLIDNGDPDHVETNFCSRALAAFAIHKLTGCTCQEAAESLVDGGADGGIDAVFWSPAMSTLWCVQSKFTNDGESEPGLQEVTRFATGMDALLSADFTELRNNPSWRARLPLIEHVLNEGGITVRAALVYSGIRLVSEDRRRLFEAIRARVSPDDDYFRFDAYNLTSVHDWLVDREAIRTVPEVRICVQKAGWLREPHEVVYGIIPLEDAAALTRTHHNRLVASNIRRYKGDTEVNEQIATTLREDPSRFLYFNNGLTAYCRRLEVRAADRNNPNQKTVRALGFSVVNGAQTLGALSSTFCESPAPNGYVFIRIISMERCDDEREFSERITRATNTQNEILTRDYVALEPEQERIAIQLAPAGVVYHYKLSDDPVPQDEYNFSVLEATTAAACLVHDASCDITARVLSNRKSLWSTVLDPQQGFSRYGRVFSSALSARSLWRAVQAQRVLLDKLREFARAEPQRRTFFENGRWVVLDVLFLRVHPENGDGLSLTDEERTSVQEAALEMSEAVWQALRNLGHAVLEGGGGYSFPRHLRSVFCDPEDCRRIKGETLRILATEPMITNG